MFGIIVITYRKFDIIVPAYYRGDAMRKICADASPDFLLTAMDAIRDGIVIVDDISRIIYVNEAYTRILEVPREKVLHRLVSEIEPGAVILDALREKKPRFNMLVQVQTRGKRIMVNITPIMQQGILRGAVSIFKDITEVSLATQELERFKRLSQSIFQSVSALQSGLPPEFSHVIGQNPAFLRCLQLARTVAPTDATVLIEGESGTGKEVIVRAMLRLSGSRQQPFVNVNCSAIPENLFESEFFGYTGGSFTGAARNGKIGKFELADKGTIFLDEIGEMPMFMQAKLLRVLQSGEIQKIGSNRIHTVDVRVIAATNQELKQMVREGTFREDLYFRLNTFNIKLPALRDRGNDILLLAEFFLKKYGEKYHKHTELSSEVKCQLLQCSWLGNVRQLESCMEYAVIMCGGNVLTLADLPEDIRHPQEEAAVMEEKGKTAVIDSSESPVALKDSIYQMEKEKMCEALQETCGNKTQAMRRLGISRRTFYKKWKAYGLDKNMYTE